MMYIAEASETLIAIIFTDYFNAFKNPVCFFYVIYAFSSILYFLIVICRHLFTIVLFPSVVRNDLTLAGNTLPGWQRDCLALMCLVSSATTPSIFFLSQFYHSK